MTHTKGPWDSSNTKTRIIGIKPAPETPDEGGNRLAQVIFSYTPDNRDYPACQRELEANARLIAAAPELLEYAELALNLLYSEDAKRGYCTRAGDVSNWAKARDGLREAINKAKGLYETAINK